MGLSSAAFMEERNGRIAFDAVTGVVTYISDMGTLYSGRPMIQEEVLMVFGY